MVAVPQRSLSLSEMRGPLTQSRVCFFREYLRAYSPIICDLIRFHFFPSGSPPALTRYRLLALEMISRSAFQAAGICRCRDEISYMHEIFEQGIGTFRNCFQLIKSVEQEEQNPHRYRNLKNIWRSTLVDTPFLSYRILSLISSPSLELDHQHLNLPRILSALESSLDD